MKSLLLFTVPLILSMGVIPALQVDLIQEADALKAQGTKVWRYGSATAGIVCGDRLCSEISDEEKLIQESPKVTIKKGIFQSTTNYTITAPEIDPEKGYFVTEIADGIFWLIGKGYQVMFVTTGQGVIVVDAPESLASVYHNAIAEVTDEPVTHFIYSHIHKDHVGAAHIFDGAKYISHTDTANHLKMKNDPHRPIPEITFDSSYTLSLGNQIIELSYIGSFHSKGDIVILAPVQKIAMAVDMFHPGAGPFKSFGITNDMNAHLQAHDILLEDYDFDVLISGHEEILATKQHIQTNKDFALDVMNNAITAQQKVDYEKIVQEFGHLGRYAIFDALFDEQARVCAELTLDTWNDKLRELEPFMEDHCVAMLFHVGID